MANRIRRERARSRPPPKAAKASPLAGLPVEAALGGVDVWGREEAEWGYVAQIKKRNHLGEAKGPHLNCFFAGKILFVKENCMITALAVKSPTRPSKAYNR